MSLINAAIDRLDAWANVLTGYGTTGDKVAAASFYESGSLRDFDLFERLLTGDPIFGKIANKVPGEAFRPGFKLDGAPDETAKVRAALDAIGDGTPGNPRFASALLEACVLSRATGGAGLILLGVNPESMPWQKGEPITGFRVAGARELLPAPSGFKLTSIDADGRTVNLLLDRSRVLPFFGEYAPPRERARLRGWGISHFVKPMRTVQQLMTAYGSVAALLADPSQAVIQIEGLWESIAAKKDQQVQKRMQLLDMNRSSGKALILDKSESFKREATPFAGLAETLQELRALLALACDMPETELFGRSPAGMNATGENDLRKWYDSIDEWRVAKAAPAILDAAGRVADSINVPRPIGVTFGALYSTSAKELADIGKIVCETADTWISNGVLTPLQVLSSLSASKSGLFSAVDFEAVQKELSRELVTYSETPDPETPDTAPQPDAAPAQVSINLTPTDIAQVVTVAEARASQGLAPFTGVNAVYNAMTVGEFAARKSAEVEAALAKEFPAPVAAAPSMGPANGQA